MAADLNRNALAARPCRARDKSRGSESSCCACLKVVAQGSLLHPIVITTSADAFVADQEEQLLKWMPAVVEYRQRLASLQGAWDNLALLSHLGDDGTNLSSTREAFETLANHLVTHLGAETHQKTVLACEARAQVAIDILVRNLFERTADVGFLAADDAICKYCKDAPASAQ